MPALTDAENCAVGVLCGVTDCTLLQATNYCARRDAFPLSFARAALLCTAKLPNREAPRTHPARSH